MPLFRMPMPSRARTIRHTIFTGCACLRAKQQMQGWFTFDLLQSKSLPWLTCAA